MKLKTLISAMLACGTLAATPYTFADKGGVPNNNSSQMSAAALQNCCTPGDKDYPKVGGNLGNQNYSDLNNINQGTVKKLGGAWVNRIEGGVNTGDNQSSPVVVDGVIYIEAASGTVYAVDGKTGVTKWKYAGKGSQTRRGLSVGEGKVFTNARGGFIVALDQNTGEVIWEVAPGSSYGNIGKVATVYYDGLVYVGTADGNRNAALALDAKTGQIAWTFFGSHPPGQNPPGNPVIDQKTGQAVVAGDTWGPAANNCYATGGAAPWVHPAIDPELKLVYWTFGNARGCASSQDGSRRPGDNLFSSSIVAMDLKTGQYKWHFQSVHHNIWDMDNVMSPTLANFKVRGQDQKAIVYGSKVGMFYILDRTNGKPLLGVEERPVPQEERQATSLTQPYPVQGGFMDTCVVEQPLGTQVPGHPARAVPNYLRKDLGDTGCLFDRHWDRPVLSTPSQNGGANWAGLSFSPRTGLVYVGYANVASAHDLVESSNGLRATGEYMTGGVVAVDVATNTVKWRKDMPYDMSHGNGIMTTKSDLLFVGLPDGNFLALDATTGEELWRFQTGASVSAAPASYEIDGEQYIAIYAGGTGIPYGNTAPRGDFLWAFKVDGKVPPAATPKPPYQRKDVSGNAVEGTTVNNTVLLARTSATSAESVAVGGMYPTHMRVPVGTTVTFTNPATNTLPHCATQFFEGLFNPKLNPGESFSYTFNKPGEYFYNDCTDPRPTGKIVVY